MGYTHYFRNVRVTPELADLAKAIIDLSDITICGGAGYGTPEISDDIIYLNGDAEKGEDYETFSLNDNADNDLFPFCKTAHRPYDKVVTAILTAAIYLKVPGYNTISSDGNISDWKDGISLFKKAWNNKHGYEPDINRLNSLLVNRIGAKVYD